MNISSLMLLVIPAGLIAYMCLEKKKGETISKPQKAIFITLSVVVPIYVVLSFAWEPFLNNVVYGFKTEILDEVSAVDWSNTQQLKNWGFTGNDEDGCYTFIDKFKESNSETFRLYIKVSKDENTEGLENTYKDIQYTSKGYVTYGLAPIEVHRLYFIRIDGVLIEAHEEYSSGAEKGPFEKFVKKLKYK